MSIIDHITLVVSDYKRSRSFYEKALAPLDIKPVRDFGEACGFGRGPKPDFWIGTGPTSFQTAEQVRVITPTHVAFVARSRSSWTRTATTWRPCFTANKLTLGRS